MRRNLQYIHCKRGDIWVSAALYMALGLILITIILSVGMPFINKIKERNTILQTKNILIEMDKVIKGVELEGVGSRRPFFVNIQEGDFLIQEEGTNERIIWKRISEDKLGIESGSNVGDLGPLIEEGNLKIQSKRVGQGYEISLWMDYKGDIDIRSDLKQLSGQYNLLIEHRQSQGQDYVEIREE